MSETAAEASESGGECAYGRSPLLVLPATLPPEAVMALDRVARRLAYVLAAPAAYGDAAQAARGRCALAVLRVHGALGEAAIAGDLPAADALIECAAEIVAGAVRALER